MFKEFNIVSCYNSLVQFLDLAVLNFSKGTNTKLWEILSRYILENNYFEKNRELSMKNPIEKSIFKACVCYFLSNFYFSPNDSPSKTMKNAFYFI